METPTEKKTTERLPKWWLSKEGVERAMYWESEEGQKELAKAKRLRKVDDLEDYHVTINGYKYPYFVVTNGRTVFFEAWTPKKGLTDNAGKLLSKLRFLQMPVQLFDKKMAENVNTTTGISFAETIEKVHFHPKNRK